MLLAVWYLIVLPSLNPVTPLKNLPPTLPVLAAVLPDIFSKSLLPKLGNTFSSNTVFAMKSDCKLEFKESASW